MASIATLAAVLALAGCESLYFHSDADLKAMDEAVGGFNTAKKSQLEAIAAQKKAVKAAIEQQRTAAVREQLAIRDEFLTVLINSNYGPDWREKIDYVTSSEMINIIGEKSAPAVKLKNSNPNNTDTPLYNFAVGYAGDLENLDSQRSQIKRQAGRLMAAGGNIESECDDKGSGLKIGAPINEKTQPLANELQERCNNLQGAWKISFGQYAPAQSSGFVACILGDLEACEANDRPAYVAFAQLYEADKLIKATEALKREATKHLEELEKNYRCALEQDNAPDAEQQIRAAAKLIRDFVDSLPLTTEQVDKQLAANPNGDRSKSTEPSRKCPGAAPAQLTLPQLLSRAGWKPEKVRGLLEKLGNWDPASSIVAELQNAKSGFEESRLATLVDAIKESAAAETSGDAGTGTAKPAALEVRVAAGVVAALGPLQRLATLRAGELPDTRAVLVDLAMARYQQSLAQIELDRLAKSKALLQLCADARLSQVVQLDYSMATARANSRREAVIAINRFWTAGAVPATAANIDLLGYRYESAAAREEASLVLRYATVEPLLAELQTYAAGGFTAEEIARLISALSLIGIAVGVN